MIVTIDFETRSDVDLKKCGPQVYFEGANTDILCTSVKVDAHPSRLWVHERLASILDNSDIPWRDIIPVVSTEQVMKVISAADIIEAHNANFERTGWREVGAARYGWDEIPFDKWRCSAAKAAASALPRSLEGAGEALGLPIQKDRDGHHIMLKMCKPRKMLKAEREELEKLRSTFEEWLLRVAEEGGPDSDDIDYSEYLESEIEILQGILWYEKPPEILKLFQYCLRDTDAEHCLSENLRELNPMQLKTWQLNQRVNDRGIPVDIETCRIIIELIGEYGGQLDAEMSAFTKGEITAASQTVKLTKYLQKIDPSIPNLQKATIEKILKKGGTKPGVAEILELRQARSKASTAKFQAFINCTGKDGTMKDTVMYHGATTGRPTGKRIQPLNMPRGDSQSIEGKILAIKTKDFDLIGLYGKPMDVFSSCIRSMIKAKPGFKLICSDFSSIESRVVAWLAGDEGTLNVFRDGKCVYIYTYAETFGVEYDDVTKDDRQIGKVATLALGFGGGWRAFMTMAVAYSLEPPEYIEVETVREMFDYQGQKLTLEEARFQKWAAHIVKKWREAHPEIAELWRDTEDAVKKAIESKLSQEVGKVVWGMNRKFLHCKLPSGRLLSYYDPEIRTKRTPVKVFNEGSQEWEVKTCINTYTGESEIVYRTSEVITYMGTNSHTRKWERAIGYGGLFVENMTQAVANDIMVMAEFRLEEAGYPEFMSVYDEIVDSMEEGRGSVEELEQLMGVSPEWALDLPIEATDGWEGERYRK